MRVNECEAKVKEFGDTSVQEYDLGSSDLGLAVATITGRFPPSGKALNTECNEIYYVLSGSCIVHHEAGDFQLEKGDALLLEKGKTYWVEATHVKLALPTSPAWNPQQFELIKE